MNVFGKDILVNAKMGKILLESEVIKNEEYHWLKDMLEQDENHTIKYSELDNLEESKKTFMTTSLFTNLYNVASDEWQIDHLVEDSEKLECSLCGEKNTIKKYYIKNKRNNKFLNVGSTCITNFKDIKSVNGKTKEELEKEWEKQQRQKILNDRYNGIIEKIENWDQKIEEIPTIVNGDLEEKYDRVYDELQNNYRKFLKGKKVEYSIAETIKELVDKGDEILNEIYQDIDNKRNNEWFITKEIKEWCYKDRYKNTIVIGFLKEDGVVKWKSACRIYEINFIKKVIKKFESILNNSNIEIIDYNEKNNELIINARDGNNYTYRINLNCAYNIFMREFGDKIFLENNNKFVDALGFVINKSEIIDYSSLDLSVNNIKYLLNKSEIKINNWDIEYNEIVFLEDKNSYNIIRLKEFINYFKEYVFAKKIGTEQIKNIKAYIVKNGNRISKNEYKNIIEMREKVDKSMQVDYSKFV